MRGRAREAGYVGAMRPPPYRPGRMPRRFWPDQKCVVIPLGKRLPPSCSNIGYCSPAAHRPSLSHYGLRPRPIYPAAKQLSRQTKLKIALAQNRASVPANILLTMQSADIEHAIDIASRTASPNLARRTRCRTMQCDCGMFKVGLQLRSAEAVDQPLASRVTSCGCTIAATERPSRSL